MNKIKIENKAAVTIHGVRPGGRATIKVDANGTPIDKHWRRRFADATLDGAIQKVKEADTKKKETK